MLNRKKALTSVAVIGLFTFASPVFAEDSTPAGIRDEVNSCVAEVRKHADYSDAVRVRHEIVAVERRTVGYTLNIDTSVFAAADQAAIREYAATCVVNGNHKPLKFTISEAS